MADVIEEAGLPWHVTELGCRAEYRFSAAPPETAPSRPPRGDDELERFLHLYALNRGVLLTPFHNMALMSPATSEADVDLHTRRLHRGGGRCRSASDVRLESVVKRFDDVVAVDGISLEIPSGSFFALLGPSGCGKTTTLRMIGGFEEPDEGSIYLGDRDVVGLPPYKRDVNTVFQSYALFPHLTIFENVAFGLAPQGRRRAAELRRPGRRDARARRPRGRSGAASRASSRAASSSASRSRARSSTARGCCSSTSRSARST